ncbi:hypothetical protein [Spirulina subsalsa]|uniref:O-linked N-acetylglucosamine transferase, SPINDLY family protein n=1 Tax=Spirulina subsalsa TaxID=54311 RepID=UPI0002FE10FE|nr:hypothetical protein [Spirulina subsalsa]
MATLEQWQEQAQQAYLAGDYVQGAFAYEQALQIAPEQVTLYWHLGLMLLLQGKSSEAQTTWLMVMLEGDEETVERWTLELVGILTQEAVRQEWLGEKEQTWRIREEIRELAPRDLQNLFELLRLAIPDRYNGSELEEWGVIPLLQSGLPLDFALLLTVLQALFSHDARNPALIPLMEASLAYAQEDSQKVAVLNFCLKVGVALGHSQRQPGIAAQLCELGLRLDPRTPELVNLLARLYQNSNQFDQGLEMARFYATLVENLPDQVFASKGVLRALMSTGGHWQEGFEQFLCHEQLIERLMTEQPELTPLQVSRLYSTYFFAPYFRDRAPENRRLQNQIAQLCQHNAQIHHRELVEKYHNANQNPRPRNQPLRIGYLSHCLRTHSVGWLARSLIKHHNQENFQLYAYFITTANTYDPLEQWYSQQVHQTYKSTQALEITEQIHHDQIDILVDLDSLTLDVSCAVTALKPAPIQITWLGWDASGIPAIDYFIADPYVLPDNAQDYYQEKIWRLPHTYIATDGFEVGIPTLNRHQLNIPPDAVIYYSVQHGYKRHLHTINLQLEILKAVPNSYFLVKGAADSEAVKRVFLTMAEQTGVEAERFRFLDIDDSEMTHRANLGMADIVLDTYPYNGATTTLETLWMGIPLVTKVGQQFSARNSYTMLKNAGITEGIAWSDEEYIQWGIRLGKDPTLRSTLAGKLKQARYQAPLWNGKQFTEDMEEAYQGMWQRFQSQGNLA